MAMMTPMKMGPMGLTLALAPHCLINLELFPSLASYLIQQF